MVHKILALSGWQRWLLAQICGAMAALALPPFYLLPLLLPAFSILYLLIIHSTRLRQAVAVGWWFGTGYFACGFYWVAHAFYVDQAQHGWMAPFAVAGIAIGLALYPALTAALHYGLKTRFTIGPIGGVVLFSVLWTGVEELRGIAFTGLPWNQPGTVWGFSDEMMQFAAIGGLPGLSFVTVLTSVSLVLLLSPSTRMAFVALLALPALIWAAGLNRLSSAQSDIVEGVRLRLVQPAIPQHLKWKNELRVGHVRRQLKMSLEPPVSGLAPTHIIWAETSVPFLLQDQSQLSQGLATVVPDNGLLLVGALRTSSPTGEQPKQIFNSLHAIDQNGTITDTYDKVHLVPFGEYVPLRNVLPVTKLTAGRGDFAVGTGPSTLNLKGLPPVAPLICYEVVFDGEVVDPSSRPKWLLNITNDGWFGLSAGPHQHLVAARFRAIEQGLPLVRVANTGISAIVDPYGRITASLPLGSIGNVDGNLPLALNDIPLWGQILARLK